MAPIEGGVVPSPAFRRSAFTPSRSACYQRVGDLIIFSRGKPARVGIKKPTKKKPKKTHLKNPTKNVFFWGFGFFFIFFIFL
jgi:hypothetical protein